MKMKEFFNNLFNAFKCDEKELSIEWNDIKIPFQNLLNFTEKIEIEKLIKEGYILYEIKCWGYNYEWQEGFPIRGNNTLLPNYIRFTCLSVINGKEMRFHYCEKLEKIIEDYIINIIYKNNQEKMLC